MGSSSISTHLCTVTMDYDIGCDFTAKHRYSFDITKAVQGWLDGNYNPDKGIMLKMSATHESGSTYTYRTVASYNRSSNKPTLAVTYRINGGAVEVNEGKTATLSASEISGTITWTSSNTAVATVSSAGVVTGVRAGTATISASVGGVVQKTFDVRVLLPDGVYWIGSAISDLYMSSDSLSITNQTAVELHGVYSGNPNNLLQMWKIHYLGNGLYSVRPMHKLDMGLSASAGNVYIDHIGSTDDLAYIDSTACWTITYNTSGYVFMRGGTSSWTLAYPTGAGENTQLTTSAYSSGEAKFRWSLVEVPFPPSGVLFYSEYSGSLLTDHTAHVVLNRNKTTDQQGLVVAVYSGDTISQAITWSSSNTSVATANRTTGTVYGVASGSATITAYSAAADTSGSYPLTVLSSEDSYYFSSYYDDGFQNISTSAITDAVTFVDMAYHHLFGIGFGSSTPIYDGTLLSDQCTTGVNLPCNDTCIENDGSCAENHHKNIFNIADEIVAKKNPSVRNVAVLWSNRSAGTYCTAAYSGDAHTAADYLACICGTRPVIHFMRSAGSYAETHEIAMGITLAHERAHIFGLSDDAGYLKPGHDVEGWACVMELYDASKVQTLRTFYYNILLGKTNAFCDSCIDILELYIG